VACREQVERSETRRMAEGGIGACGLASLIILRMLVPRRSPFEALADKTGCFADRNDPLLGFESAMTWLARAYFKWVSWSPAMLLYAGRDRLRDFAAFQTKPCGYVYTLRATPHKEGGTQLRTHMERL
jgi:hypothetical protein